MVLLPPSSFLLPQPTLGLAYETRDSNQNTTPFDERALEGRALSSRTVWESVGQGLV
jgi:hypothetical protein